MSSLIIEVCEVKSVEPHPNAERMCVVTVKGWRVCAGRDPASGQNQFAPDQAAAGKFGGREGVVVTAARERVASTGEKFFDRAQAKLISFDYLARKGGTEYH